MAHKINLTGIVVLGAVLIGVSSVAATPTTPPTQGSPAAQPPTSTSNSTTVVVTAQPADTPTTSGQPNMNRVICRTRPVLGSRLNKLRECRTAAEWEGLRRQASSGADGATRAMSKAMVKAGN
jgi:hypothetical protein